MNTNTHYSLLKKGIKQLWLFSLCCLVVGGVFPLTEKAKADVGSPTLSVTATIPVGSKPNGLAISPDGSFAYVGNSNNGTISRIRTSDNTVVATMSIGGSPAYVVFDPAGVYAYISNSGSNNITRIKVSDNSQTSIGVGVKTFDMVITSDGSFLYALSNDSGNLKKIRTSDNTVVATISIGSKPIGLALSLSNDFVYTFYQVSNTDYKLRQIRVADNTIIATVSGFYLQPIITISPDGSYAYVNSWGDNATYRVRTSDNVVVARIAEPGFPIQTVFSPDGEYAYVTNRVGKVVQIRTIDNVITATVSVGNTPNIGIDISPDGSFLYVANLDSNTVSRIGIANPQTLSTTLSATPTSGTAPFSPNLTASVSGTATGTTNYSFFCNRSDSATTPTNTADLKFDGQTATTKSTSGCTYDTAGTYTAKVIVERGSAPAVEARVTITVAAAPTPPPTLGVTFTATPNSGDAPFPSTLTAQVTGTTTGTINYTFYCDRADTSTTVDATTWPDDGKFDNKNYTSKSISCNYDNLTTADITKKAKVIIERESGKTQAQVDVLVKAGGPFDPLSVIMDANPTTGTGEVTSTITATVTGGNPRAPIDYVFYCNSAGSIGDSSSQYFNFSNQMTGTKSVSCTYTNSGTDPIIRYPLVMIERNGVTKQDSKVVTIAPGVGDPTDPPTPTSPPSGNGRVPNYGSGSSSW